MRISVVIPTLNEERYVGDLLRDLAGQSLLPVQIVVVDGQSEDGTQRVVSEHKGVEFLRSEVRAVGYQRTLGGRAAVGEWIVFLDADVRIEVDFLKQVAEELGRRRLECAVVQYWPQGSNWAVWWFFTWFNVLFWFAQKVLPSGAGSCVVVKRRLFERSGGFGWDTPYDDIELIRKLGKMARFGVLGVSVRVSDRRFRKFGVWWMWRKYLLLSWYFMWGDFERAKRVEYEFGKF